MHLEDSDLDAELIEASLQHLSVPVDIVRVFTKDTFTDAVRAGGHHLILADYLLPTFDGIAALAVAKSHSPDVPFVFVTGAVGEDVAVEALKNGATDYVSKDRLDRLPHNILRALSEARLRREREEAVEALRAMNETLEQRVAERTVELAGANEELRRQIAERERVEEELRLTQRLEAVGQLTSGVAHDFNNLLTVIAGNIGFLERAVSDERSVRRLGMMRNATERGAKLTAQLLAFSRRQRLEPKPVALNDVVTAMGELLQSSIGGSVRIETTLQPDLWPALVDATQIELVILNLAINARDAMEVGGCLTIETANVEVTGEPRAPGHPAPGQYAMISVSDTGTGIEPGVLSRIFEPFFTTKEVGKGSGLGLAQVYGFVKQSAGGIAVETVVGEGTSFRIYLPRVWVAEDRNKDDDARADERAERENSNRMILVVDDDAAVREVTATRLSEAGHTVREAGSGLAAILALNDDADVDLVVMDYAMPGMNGVEAAKAIAERWPAIPILFVTGYADTLALTGVAATSSGIVQKPFQDGVLERRVAVLAKAARQPRLGIVGRSRPSRA